MMRFVLVRLAARLRALWHVLWVEWPALLGVPVGWLRSHRQLLAAWPEGVPELGARVVLFCHFDRAGAVRPHVLGYVEALRQAGLSVVFVSNAGRLEAAAQARLQGLCAAILVRRNAGYDFAAWREALEHLGLPRPQTELLILANDSVYGPLIPLGEMLGRIDATADFWGATESWQYRYHMQSYFLAAGAAALRSPGWRAFWAGVRAMPSKHYVVTRYEVGLTQALLREGLRCAALFPYPALLARVPPTRRPGLAEIVAEEIDPLVEARATQAGRIRAAAARRIPLNPTSDLWRQLLAAGFPFIKRELLRDNPSRVADLADWREVLGAIAPAALGPIEVDLRRTLRHRAG